MHDQWIGLLADLFGKVEFLDEVLMLYRRHGDSMTDNRPGPLKQRIAWRRTLIMELVRRCRKIRSER